MEQGVNLAVHHGTAAVLTSHETRSQSGRGSGSGNSHQSQSEKKWLQETPESSFVSVPVIGIVVAIAALALLVRSFLCMRVCDNDVRRSRQRLF